MSPPRKTWVEEQLATLKADAVVTSGGFEPMPLSIEVYAAGLLPQVMGDGKNVISFRRITEGGKLPKKV